MQLPNIAHFTHSTPRSIFADNAYVSRTIDSKAEHLTHAKRANNKSLQMDTNKIKQIKQRYEIVGNHEGLNRALDIATQVAATDLSVLIIGESGVGKEVLPRVIHDHSSRKHNKYFAINCGSLPEGTIDSELFGHKKGSFTGAVEDREGYFGAANNGTLFLDEVGELPIATQARLLRVLETGEYIRVGESEVRKTNVRIVAATNVNMQKAIKEGKFREDLYYRLNTIPINMPPLRERGRDIELLFRKFALVMAEKYRIDPIYLDDEATRLLLSYKWPGNIRELRNLTERLSIISEERMVTAQMLAEQGVTDDSSEATSIVPFASVNRGQQLPNEHSYEKERDMLFRMLNNIVSEVSDLKALVNGNMGSSTPTPAVQPVATDITPIVAQPSIIQQPVQQITNAQSDNGPWVDIVPQTIEVKHMTIKEQNKSNIIEALERNNGNRKKAAAELDISERTLYRKIKDYKLDNI